MISYDQDSRKATKCHLCLGKPKCVEACPAGSLSYVPWRDLTGEASPRNPKTALLSLQRAQSCQECHLPGRQQNIRQTSGTIRRILKGEKADSSDKIGFKWIDLAGAFAVPLAIGLVLTHAVLRKIIKK
jgi:Fe-S-cluster-containing dehydrogenase component